MDNFFIYAVVILDFLLLCGMAKGEKWKALWNSLRLSNRFWGVCEIVVGGTLIIVGGLGTPVAYVGGAILTVGLSQANVGVVGKAKRVEEEKKAAPDQVESKIN